jgi:hypothetical protein
MLDKPYAQQALAGLIVVAASAFFIFMGWLTAEQHHGLSGIILWCFCYGIPVAVLFRWFQPYVSAIAVRAGRIGNALALMVQRGLSVRQSSG